MGFIVKKQHSIKSVIFAFEHLPLSQDCLRELAENPSIKEAFADLPKFGIMHGLTFTVGVGQDTALIPPQSQQQLGGVSFEKIGPNGEPMWSISVQENATVIFCAAYTRWAPTWSKAREYLRVLIPHILSKATVLHTALQYTDEFESAADKSAFQVREIFESSHYFADSILDTFQRGGHCHTGFFENVDEIAGRVLHNININIVETPLQYQVQLVCAHKAYLDERINGVSVNDVEGNGQLTKIFDSLHIKHKNVLNSILTTEAKTRIGFDINSKDDENGTN